MFGRKTVEKKEYDRENLHPVLRCSICTGEQVAGFKTDIPENLRKLC